MGEWKQQAIDRLRNGDHPDAMSASGWALAIDASTSTIQRLARLGIIECQHGPRNAWVISRQEMVRAVELGLVRRRKARSARARVASGRQYQCVEDPSGVFDARLAVLSRLDMNTTLEMANMPLGSRWRRLGGEMEYVVIQCDGQRKRRQKLIPVEVRGDD